MASNEDRYNNTECPVCMETFKNPKLLPCTHTYCLQCLEKIVGGSKSFLCPECKTNMEVPSRGLQGIPDNRYIHAILRVTEEAKQVEQEKLHAVELLEVSLNEVKLLEVKLREEKIKTKKGKLSEPICASHKQPLLLYCNDECQQAICALCVLKHKGHKIVDIAEKYIEVNKHIKGVLADAEYLNAKYNGYLLKLEEVEKEVKKSANKIIGEIDKIQEEMIQQIKYTIKGPKLEVLQIKEQNIHKIQVAKVKLSGFRKLLSDFSTNLSTIERISIHELMTSRNNAADTLSAIKVGIFNENVAIGIEKMMYQELDISNQLVPKLDYVEKIEKKIIYLPLGVIPYFTLKQKWNIGHHCFQTSYSKDEDYLLISCRHNARHFIKGFTSKGQEAWQHYTGKDICGHAIVRDDTDYLIVVHEHELELCSLTDGVVLDTLDIPFDAGYLGACAVEDKSFLVVDSSIRPNSLAKFEIRDSRLVNMNAGINTDLCDIDGLYYCSERGLVCVTSCSENTIEAIDYTNNYIKWKIGGECESRLIQPRGVTGDNKGNLYVADIRNERVLMVRDGRIIHVLQIPDRPYPILDVCCKPSYDDAYTQLFVMSYKDDANSTIQLHHIHW